MDEEKMVFFQKWINQLVKENRNLRENMTARCRCIEVDVWKQKCYHLSQIVFDQKNKIENLEEVIMYDR